MPKFSHCGITSGFFCNFDFRGINWNWQFLKHNCPLEVCDKSNNCVLPMIVQYPCNSIQIKFSKHFKLSSICSRKIGGKKCSKLAFNKISLSTKFALWKSTIIAKISVCLWVLHMYSNSTESRFPENVSLCGRHLQKKGGKNG